MSLYKNIRSCEIHSVPGEQYEGTHPFGQLSPAGSLPQHVEIMGIIIQDEIWVGIQSNHTTIQFYQCCTFQRIQSQYFA